MADGHIYVNVDPLDHTHSVGEVVGADGNALRGPAGRDGLDGKDGADGAQGAQGAQGPAGADGANGTNGADGRDGRDGDTGPAGADAVLPLGLVTIGDTSGTLYGSYTPDTVLRVVSGVASVTFLSGYGAFALPEGTQGIASFNATLMDSMAPIGVKAPTDASAIGLLSATDGTFKVAYLALIW